MFIFSQYFVPQMRIPLAEFEQIIDPAILKRGFNYYQAGFVEPPQHLSEHQIETTVHGTEDYTVTMQIEGDTILDFVCECPYEAGPVCKHVSAVIFHLVEGDLDFDERKPAKVPKIDVKKHQSRRNPRLRSQEDVNEKAPLMQEDKEKAKHKSKSGGTSDKSKVEKLVNELSTDQLKHYLLEQVLKDKKQSIAFLVAFSSGTEGESKALYSRQIKALLNSASGRGGFIDWGAGRKVGKALDEILGKARIHFESGRIRSTMLICFAVMEEMVKALDFADDSNGNIGGAIEEAYYLLISMIESPLSEDIRKEMFDYSLSSYKQKTFSGWDWHAGMAELAVLTHRTREEAIMIRNMLEQPTDSEYELEGQQMLTYRLTQSIDGPDVAKTYLEAHLENRSFLELAISEAFNKEDYIRLEQLAREGIKRDLKPAPGMVHVWYDWLIRVAQVKKDAAKVLEYARLVFLQHARDPDIYYQLIKETVASKKWPIYLNEMIQEIRNNPRYRLHHFIPIMYYREEDWEGLMEYIIDESKESGVDLRMLDEYSTPLATKYPEEFVRLYQDGLRQNLRHFTNRNDYQRICQHLRRLKKLGFSQQVSEIVESLRKEYAKRPALIEELKGV